MLFGILTKPCLMEISGVLTERLIKIKEPKITQMDWRSLGYWPVWKNGKKVWVPKDKVTDSESQDS